METKAKDNLFMREDSPEKFEFNESVARVFDDMLERSVPLYRECQEMAIRWCLRFAHKGSNIYDLGCSTGTLLKNLAHQFPADAGVRLIGVDNSAPMLEKARAKLASSSSPWKLVEADLNQDFGLTNASVIVMNYTLQFIAPEKRLEAVRRFYAGLNPGGLLILIEKVKSESAQLDQSYIEFHHEFKRSQGYSQMEISRKRDALENVLIPLTAGENIHLLREAGFSSAEIFCKWNNFAGFVALK